MLRLTISSTGDLNLEFDVSLSRHRLLGFVVRSQSKKTHQSDLKVCVLRHIFIKTAALEGRRLSEISRYNSASNIEALFIFSLPVVLNKHHLLI